MAKLVIMITVKQLKEGLIVLNCKGIKHEIIKIKKGGLLGVNIRLKNVKTGIIKTYNEHYLSELYLTEKDLLKAEKERQKRVKKYLKETGGILNGINKIFS